jgi:DNA-binding NarL/FixJ family response regulator
MTRKIRILLADDHAMVRKGFRLILSQENDIEIVGEAGSGQEAIQAAIRLVPDVVILDIAMPGINGVEATRLIAYRQ